MGLAPLLQSWVNFEAHTVRAPQFNGKGKKRGKMRFASGVAVNVDQHAAQPWLEGRPGFVRRDAPQVSQGWLKRNDYRRTYVYSPSKHGSLPRQVLANTAPKLAVKAIDTSWGAEDGHWVLCRYGGNQRRCFQYKVSHDMKKP